MITETWFSCKQTDDILKISGYVLFRRDQANRKGGGVCMYVRSDIDAEVLTYKNRNTDVEILWLKLSFKDCLYCVACGYIPPNPCYDEKLFILSLVDGIENAFNAFSPDYIIVAGDFNDINCSLLESHCGLIQLVSCPTHGSNILDKFFTNRPGVYSAGVCKSLIKTKHLAVIITGLRSMPPLPKSKRTCVKLFDLREHNLNFLRICVANFDWRPLFESTDIDDIYSLF